MYILTCPASNMYGLFYLPICVIAHDCVLTHEGASEGLRRVSEGGLCLYESPSEGVFVPRMAAWQIGETITVSDNRYKGILKDLSWLRKMPFFPDFYGIYRVPFNLPSEPLRSPFGDPPKGVAPTVPPKPRTGTGTGTGTGGASPLPSEGASPEDFEDTAQGLGQLFHHYQRGHKQDLHDITDAIGELLRLHNKPSSIRQTILAPERKRTESIWDFAKRFKNGDHFAGGNLHVQVPIDMTKDPMHISNIRKRDAAAAEAKRIAEEAKKNGRA